MAGPEECLTNFGSGYVWVDTRLRKQAFFSCASSIARGLATNVWRGMESRVRYTMCKIFFKMWSVRTHFLKFFSGFGFLFKLFSWKYLPH